MAKVQWQCTITIMSWVLGTYSCARFPHSTTSWWHIVWCTMRLVRHSPRYRHTIEPIHSSTHTSIAKSYGTLSAILPLPTTHIGLKLLNGPGWFRATTTDISTAYLKLRTIHKDLWHNQCFHQDNKHWWRSGYWEECQNSDTYQWRTRVRAAVIETA